jgi:hypothetical protein
MSNDQMTNGLKMGFYDMQRNSFVIRISSFIRHSLLRHSSFRPLGLVVLFLLATTAGADDFRPLWDGKSLEGWHTIPGGEWKIEEGVIVGRNEASDPRHGHLVTDDQYGDFTVRLKFKAVKGNSGLYFRIEKVPGDVGVKGFQAEIDAANDVGGLYETHGRAWVVQPKPEQVKEFFKPGEWNEMTVSAAGRNVVVHVNGVKTAELKDDPGRTEGYLALQLHGSQDVEVHFKDLEIAGKPLKK